MTITFRRSGKEVSLDEMKANFFAESEILSSYLQDFDVIFEVEGDRLLLVNTVGTPLEIEVHTELTRHRKFFHKHSIYQEPLAKALGVKKGRSLPLVVDATAGLLGDTLLMVAFGLRPIAFEKHPLVSALIVNALKKTDIPIDFRFGDCSQLKEKVDVIYFDPMYESHNKKAAPKKSMQVFREIVGVDLDASAVATKLKNHCQRLVIKRSVKGDYLLPNPSMSFAGKSTRYDVYLAL